MVQTDVQMSEIKPFNGHVPLPYRVKKNQPIVLIGEKVNYDEAKYEAFISHNVVNEKEAMLTAEFIAHACNTYYETQKEIAKLKKSLFDHGHISVDPTLGLSGFAK